MLQAHVAMDLIRSHHGSPTTVGALRSRQIAMIAESEPQFSKHKSVVPSSNRPDHTTLLVQFSADRSTNLIRSRKRTIKHICVGSSDLFSIVMKALLVTCEKRVTKCIFSRFAMRGFKLLQAHVAVDQIRSPQGSPTTVGGLRTRQIAMVGESEPPFACHKSAVRSSNRPDHMTLHV